MTVGCGTGRVERRRAMLANVSETGTGASPVKSRIEAEAADVVTGAVATAATGWPTVVAGASWSEVVEAGGAEGSVAADG